MLEPTMKAIIKRKVSLSPSTSNKKRKTTNSNYKIDDIVYENSTAKKCIDQYDDLISCTSKNIHKNLVSTLTRVADFKLWANDTYLFPNMCGITYIDTTYMIGDIVKVSYIPCSQKYLDYYDNQSFTGTIIFIDADKENAFFLIEGSNEIKSLKPNDCHFLGTTPGYDYIIEPVS